MISLAQIFKEIFAEKTRALLTIFAIAWGSASIAGMLAVGEGLRLTFGRAMAGAGKSVLYVAGGQTATAYQGQSINQKVTLTLQDVAQLRKAIPNVALTYEYILSTPLVYQQKKTTAPISAVAPLYAELRSIQVQAGGRFINEDDMLNHRQVIVIGNKRAENLFGSTINPLGLTVTIADKPFTVIGVMQPKLQMWGYMAPDAYVAWIPLSTYEILAQPNQVTDLVIVPNKPKQLAAIKQQITHSVATNHRLDPNDKNLLIFRDSSAAQAATQSLFRNMEIFLGVVGGLTLIIAGVGVATVMFVSVRQATRDIGIRMAVGARSYQILIHYLVESLVTTLLGGIAGILITKVIVWSVAQIPVKQKIFQFIGVPRPILSLQVFIIVSIVLGIVGLLAGLFPARRAANVNPAEALRHE